MEHGGSGHVLGWLPLPALYIQNLHRWQHLLILIPASSQHQVPILLNKCRILDISSFLANLFKSYHKICGCSQSLHGESLITLCAAAPTLPLQVEWELEFAAVVHNVCSVLTSALPDVLSILHSKIIDIIIVKIFWCYIGSCWKVERSGWQGWAEDVPGSYFYHNIASHKQELSTWARNGGSPFTMDYNI